MKEKKALFLSYLFQHLDGIALIPTIMTLEQKKILSNFNECSLSFLTQSHKSNEAYLNVALRLLCSQGWLQQSINNNNVHYELREKHIDFTEINTTYSIAYQLYDQPIDYNVILQKKKQHINCKSILFKTIEKYINEYQKKQTLSIFERHVEGAILGPIIVELAMNNVFFDHNTNWFKKINPSWEDIIKELFICSKMIDTKNQLTEYGTFILKRASSYGVTVSYLPTFRNIKELIFGNHKLLWSNYGEIEKHVDRSMNVWGSGGAHNTYFKKVDEIILDLFNLPIEKQPKGFIDIGCGNGKLIEHIFDLIYYKTLRGKHLKKYPLFIVGSDFNYKALEATNETIKKADIWAKTAFGDISDPDSLAKRLKEQHQINLVDLLNVRSFLDHNRIYEPPIDKKFKNSNSTGSFCYKGEKITNSSVQQNLKEHLKRWYPYLTKYGLLIVELHTIDPMIASKNIGKTAITAYDASHGFSDQYILEYDLFLQTAKEIGLQPDDNHEYIFPSREIPIVSINRFISKSIDY